MNQLMIIGAGGHGRVVADIAEKLQKYQKICFLDDADMAKSGGYDVTGAISTYHEHLHDACFVVAIGNPLIREKVQLELEKKNAKIETLIHPSAVIGERTKIGKGTVVMAGAVINPDTTIGKGVIINTSSSVDHDCEISDFAHVSVGAHVAGTVFVGAKTMIGAGATVSNNLNICDECVIGSGAVVVRDIVEKGTYVGVPARKLP